MIAAKKDAKFMQSTLAFAAKPVLTLINAGSLKKRLTSLVAHDKTAPIRALYYEIISLSWVAGSDPFTSRFLSIVHSSGIEFLLCRWIHGLSVDSVLKPATIPINRRPFFGCNDTLGQQL